MDRLEIERIGGFAGFGAAGAHICSKGSVELESLSVTDQRTIRALFDAPSSPAGAARPDEFRYKVTRHSSQGSKTVEVGEEFVPPAVRAVVKDQLVWAPRIAALTPRHWVDVSREWFEAYIGDAWHTFDPRNNVPRIGRVLIARGRDAADVAISTAFGANQLISFKVWTDQTD